MNRTFGSQKSDGFLEEQKAAQHEQDLQRLQEFRLMDDDFLSAFFRDNIEDTEFILRIILNRPTLRVKSVHAQYELKNLNGRSVRIDVHAIEEDAKGRTEAGGIAGYICNFYY